MSAVWTPKPYRERAPRRNSASGKKAHIEALAARGVSRDDIKDQTGASIEYVSQILRYQSRTASDDAPGSDCEQHVRAIYEANGGQTFPFYTDERIERAGL
jgi:hypothetical protein